MLSKANSPLLEWIRVPELWPQLESLECRQCTGLTIDRLPELLPEMSHLKTIRIPDSILQNVPDELSRRIIRDFSTRDKPLEIAFVSFLGRINACLFQSKQI